MAFSLRLPATAQGQRSAVEAMQVNQVVRRQLFKYWNPVRSVPVGQYRGCARHGERRGVGQRDRRTNRQVIDQEHQPSISGCVAADF
jgi:hypothetical protein